jgi:hypothetical protein
LQHLASEEGTDNDEKAKLIQGLFQAAELRKDEASGSTSYFWPSLKWYPDFPDVIFVESFLETLEEDEYYLIRLGESDDDTEIRGLFWDNPFSMCLARSIAFD